MDAAHCQPARPGDLPSYLMPGAPGRLRRPRAPCPGRRSNHACPLIEHVLGRHAWTARVPPARRLHVGLAGPHPGRRAQLAGSPSREPGADLSALIHAGGKPPVATGPPADGGDAAGKRIALVLASPPYSGQSVCLGRRSTGINQPAARCRRYVQHPRRCPSTCTHGLLKSSTAQHAPRSLRSRRAFAGLARFGLCLMTDPRPRHRRPCPGDLRPVHPSGSKSTNPLVPGPDKSSSSSA